MHTRSGALGLVLSGGGARAAYQIGALKALVPYMNQESNQLNVIVGSSIGAINGLLMGACMKNGYEQAVTTIEEIWKERTFRNTFADNPSGAFFRSIKLAVMQILNPGPHAQDGSIFNPTPLMQRVDQVINDHGGLSPNNRAAALQAIAVMTTVEGTTRKPLLFVSSHKQIEPQVMEGASFDVYYTEQLHAKHGFASAALPSVLPPVEIDTEQGTVRLVDGGISQNVPVDPAARLGADRMIVVDISGRDWWLERDEQSLDTRPDWEVAAAEKTFCLRPPDTFIVRCRRPLGEVLKYAVGSSKTKFISAVGPLWPVFMYLKNKLGEEVAYETLSYVALDQEYILGLLERGYNETLHILRNRAELEYSENKSYQDLVDKVVGN